MEGTLWVRVLHDADLQVPLSHFSLEGVLECLDSCMNSITNIHVIRVGLLEEAACLGRSLTQCSGLPAVERAAGFNLEDLGAFLLIDTADNHSNAEGPHTATLRVLLEQVGDLLAEHEG